MGFRNKIMGKIRALQVKEYKAQGADPRLKPLLKALQRIHKDCKQMTCLEAAESWIDREISSLESSLQGNVPELMPCVSTFTWVGGFKNQYKLFMYWWAKDQIILLHLEHPSPELPSLESTLGSPLATLESLSSLKDETGTRGIRNSVSSGRSFLDVDRKPFGST